MAGATWIALRHGPRWGAVAVAGALMISTTRLYVGVHYPTDLVAGWALGCVTALGVDRLTRWADAR
jgi:undecaprenyl-diphosphatase